MQTSDLQTLPAPARPWQVRPWQVVQTAARLPLLAALEARLAFRVIRRDLSTTIVPGTLFVVAAHGHSFGAQPALALLPYVACGALYYFLYVYTFCLGNQIAGMEEDRVNKPDRPLPSGQMTLRGAWIRWGVVNVVFPSTAFALGGLRLARWALAWQLIAFSYDFLGLHRKWYGKNLVFISLGTVVLLAPAWELVGQADADAWRWIVVVALVIGVSFHIQDLRDVSGDALVGRKTLPIVLGEMPARYLLVACVLLFPVIVHVVLMAGHASPNIARMEVALAVLNVIVAIRMIAFRTPRADHWTYIIHTYWFCAVLASSIPVLQRT